MGRVAIIYKYGSKRAKGLGEEIVAWLQKRGMEVFFRENDVATPPGLEGEQLSFDIPEDVSFAVVLGGDGTLLSVARHLKDRTAPLMGVNMGAGMGFLTDVGEQDLFASLEKILKGQYSTEPRMRLKVRVVRKGTEVFESVVLNDVVLNKGALSRIVDIEVDVDGKPLTTYRADGLIITTPTGSTAYNLSAGGPIIYPTAEVMVLNPICPFTFTHRSIVLPGKSELAMSLERQRDDVVLTCDGQVGFLLKADDKVEVKMAEKPVELIKTTPRGYFETLRHKLRWGERAH